MLIIEGRNFVGIYSVISKVHGGAALLFFSLAIISVLISVLIAVKPAADPANARLVKKANFVGLLEIVLVGVVTLTGVAAVFMGSLSWSQSWLWMSLMIMVFYTRCLRQNF